MPDKRKYTYWSARQIKEMADLYDSGKSLAEVGEEYGISKQRVNLILRKNGYQTRSRATAARIANLNRKPRILERDILDKFYLEKRLTITEMANQLKISYPVIRKSLIYHKIPIRSANDYRFTSLTRELLEPLYLEENLTAREIAGRLGFSLVAITKRLSKLGIKKEMSKRRFGWRRK
jgi:transcriptional regulator with XRE-family HTH domain